ncbi:LPXTG cell wall anchor domain-containing protein [Paenibacillus filicis]|uniref:LPXTG cell wall anchor domain-containing protein n=1 Tax=Paenibacillus filicis TaxID=669464 RepID=A0ABU9DRC5_9BACL
MKGKVNRTLALWMSVLLVLALVFPLLGLSDTTARAFEGSDSSLTVQPNVYGEVQSSATVVEDVYEGACKPWTATTQPVWQSILKPNLTAGKVTFTIPEGYCDIQLSFSSYGYKDNVQPNYMGAPYNKQYLYDNKTAIYGPGTYTVEVNIPCGYWQLDLYKGPVISSIPYGHPAALLIKALVNYQVNSCTPEPEPPSLDLIDASALCVNTAGVLRFELTNRNTSSVTVDYTLGGTTGQVTLEAHASKVIEIVSNSTAILQVALNGVSKNTVAANPASCPPDPESPVALIDVSALCVKESGKVRFEFKNRNAVTAEVSYSLSGTTGEVTLAAGETKIVELASTSKELLTVTVKGVSKTTVAPNTENCPPDPESPVDLIDVTALCVQDSGKVGFQLTNRNKVSAEVGYSLGDTTGQVTLAAGESKTVELASTSKEPLTITVKGVSKKTVAPNAESCHPVQRIDAAPLCVNQSGIVRFQLTNGNETVTEVTYSLKGVIGHVSLVAKGSSVIQLSVASNGELLKVEAGGESKETVAASTVLCSNPGDGDPGGGDPGDGDPPGGNPPGGNPPSTVKVPDDKVPTGPVVKPDPSKPTTPSTPTVPGTDPAVLPEKQEAPDDQTQPAASEPEVLIPEGDIPLGYPVLPQTGEKLPWTYYGIGTLLIAAGIVSGIKRRRTGA